MKGLAGTTCKFTFLWFGNKKSAVIMVYSAFAYCIVQD